MRSLIDLSKCDIRKNRIDKIIELTQNRSGRLYIWGKGVYAKVLAAYLKENGVTALPVWVVDDAYYSEGDKEDIIPLSRLLEIYSEIDTLIYGIYDYKAYIEAKKLYGNRFSHFYDFHFVVVNDVIVKWDHDYVKKHFTS